MPRAPKKAAAKKSTRLKQAARQAVIDADHLRQDLSKLLLSLEDLSVEALQEVSGRALALIAEKTGQEKRSLVGAVIGGAVSVGESVVGLFSRPEPASKGRGKKAR
jgi:hypothetical protein